MSREFLQIGNDETVFAKPEVIFAVHYVPLLLLHSFQNYGAKLAKLTAPKRLDFARELLKATNWHRNKWHLEFVSYFLAIS